MSKKRYYLAYGSNLNRKQMEMRCPGARVVGTALIKGYGLLFKGSKTGFYLTIEPKADGVETSEDTEQAVESDACEDSEAAGDQEALPSNEEADSSGNKARS